MVTFIGRALLVGSCCLASGSPNVDEPKGPDAARAAHESFDRIKKLAGTWKGEANHGPGAGQPATVTYRITANGSTVVETLFGGTSHEMITMYHLDKGDLVATHYCSLGNQPRMRESREPSARDPKKLVLKFDGGTNFDAAKDMHMHEAVIEFVDEDHIKSEWVMFAGGKSAGAAKFDLKRETSPRSGAARGAGG